MRWTPGITRSFARGRRTQWRAPGVRRFSGSQRPPRTLGEPLQGRARPSRTQHAELLEEPHVSALAWWLIPLAALIGVLSYVLWVTKFQARFQNETTRSVSQFQRFQNSFRDRAEADAALAAAEENAAPRTQQPAE